MNVKNQGGTELSYNLVPATIYITATPTFDAPTAGAALTSGTIGTAYTNTVELEATGGALKWSIPGNDQPPGLDIDEDTGEISGTPTADGTFNFTVKVENNKGSATRAFSITINKPALTDGTFGTGGLSGTGKFEETLTADIATAGRYTVTPTALPGAFTYQWKRADAATLGNVANIGTPTTSNTYVLTQADIGSWVFVTITAANCSGSIDSNRIGPVDRADGPAAPTAPAPTMASRTINSITLNTISGAEYNIDGGAWQDSPTFGGLAPNTSYTFGVRIKETPTVNASDPSYNAVLTAKPAPGESDLTYTKPFPTTHVFNGSAQGIGSVTLAGATVTVYYNDVNYFPASGPTNAGTYTVKVDVTEGTNFAAATGITLVGTYTIDPQTITITPNPLTKVYSGSAATDPALTYANTALAGGGALSGTLGRAAGEDVGTSYAINNISGISVTTGTPANYTLVLNSTPVYFSITPAAASTISITDQTKNVRYSTATLQTVNIADLFTAGQYAPSGANLTYGLGSITGDTAILVGGTAAVGATSGSLTYTLVNTLADTDAGKTVTIPVTVTGFHNYSGTATVNVIVNVMDKIQVEAADINTATTTTVTYSGSSQVLSGATVTNTGSKYGSGFTSSDISYSYVGAVMGPVVAPINADTYTVTITVENADYYGTKDVTLIINPKQLTWGTAGTVVAKTYDGDADATIAAPPGLSGVVSPDAVTVDDAGATVTFNNANAGTGKAITATGFDITGTDAANYIAPTGNPTFTAGTINAKALIITGVAHTKPYDGNTTASGITTLTMTGYENGEGIAALGTLTVTAAYLSADAGTTVLNITTAVTYSAAAKNYTIAPLSGFSVVGIIPKDINITSATIADQAWTGLTPIAVADVTVTFSGEVTQTPVTYSVDDANFTGGTYTVGNGRPTTIDVSLTGAAATNYNLTNGTGYTGATANIVRASVLAPSAPTADVVTSESVTLDTIAGAEYRRGASGAWQDAVLFDDLTPNTEYTFYARLKQTATHNASLASAALTVSTLKVPTASDFTFTNPTGNTYTGVAQAADVDEKAAGSMGAITIYYNGSSTTPTNAGTYAITVDVAAGAEFDAKDGIPLDSYTIEKAELTIDDATITKAYDGTLTLPVGNVTAVGFLGIAGMDVINYTVTAAAYTDNANVGTSKAVTFTIGLLNPSANNYRLTGATFTGAIGEITKAPAGVVHKAVSVNAGGSYPFSLESLLPSVTGTTGTVTYKIDSVTDSNNIFDPAITGGPITSLTLDIDSGATAGQSATIVVEIESENYTIPNATITVTVTDDIPVAISGVTVTTRDYNKTAIAASSVTPVFTDTTAGDPVTGVFTAVYTWGGTEADGSPFSATGPANGPTNAGTYTLTVSADPEPGYEVDALETHFSITPATITVTAANKTAKVGAGWPFAAGFYTYTETGRISGDAWDDEPVPSATPDNDGSNLTTATTYPITFTTMGDAGLNYIVNHIPGILTVNPLSDDCDVISATVTSSTSSPVVNQGARTITADVAHTVASVTIGVTASPFAEWTLHTDAACLTPAISPATMTLTEGANTRYIKVVSENTFFSKIYTLTVTKAAEPIITTYTVTIEEGGTGFSGGGSYEEGDTVSINAGTKSGHTFSGWTASPSVTFASASSAATTFTMPDDDVTVTANWTPTGGGGGGDYYGGGSSGGGTTTGNTLKVGNTNVGYTEKDGVVTLDLSDDIVKKLIDNAGDGEIAINLSDIKDATAVELTADAAQTFSDADVTVTLTLPSAEITLVPDTLGLLADTAEKGEHVITVEAQVVPMKDLKGMQAAQVKGYELVVDISVYLDGKKVEAPVTVSMPYTLKANQDPKGVQVWHMDDSGKLTNLKGTYDKNTGMITFSIDHQSYFVVGYDPVALWENIFADLEEDAWYYDAVAFANFNNFIHGDGTNFKPDGTLTRAMFATLVWKYEGSPTPKGTAGFDDVPDGTWYTEAVLWAAENGIVTGTGAGFNPTGPLTHQAMVTLLHNYVVYKGFDIPVNQEAAYGDAGNIDVWAESAAKELADAGVLNGFINGDFNPTQTATRAEVAQLFKDFIRLIADND